jgi:hypothetical protein
MKGLARPRLRRSFLGAASQDQTSLCSTAETRVAFSRQHRVAGGASGGQGWTGPIVVLAAIEPENVRFSGSQDDTFMHGAMHNKKAAFSPATREDFRSLPLSKRRTHYLDRRTHRSDWPRTPARKAAFTLGSPAIPFANHAAPCCQALGRMLLHPLGELRRAHQAGLHRNVSEVRGGDGLLVTICRRGETAEHSDDLDHDRRTPMTL